MLPQADRNDPELAKLYACAKSGLDNVVRQINMSSSSGEVDQERQARAMAAAARAACDRPQGRSSAGCRARAYACTHTLADVR